MHRLLREPLLHFLILGALLFGLYGWLRGSPQKGNDEIVLSRGQLQSLQAQFQRTRLRSPTPEEVQGLVESWVREEIFYREGLAIGLDRDDPVVRRRVAQKLEFIGEDAVGAAPTPAELQGWLAAHADAYRIDARYSLEQIYIDVARHGAKLDADVAALRRSIASGRAPVGDPTLLPPSLERATASQVQRVFGKEFAEMLKTLPVGSWQGPLRSAFGQHLVRLGGVEAARPATLDEVRADVERDFVQARTAELKAARYRDLRARYVVRTDPISNPAQ
jgi:hypothetical protein